MISVPAIGPGGFADVSVPMSASSRLADMIVEALGNDSHPVVELAGRLDVDWTAVLAVLEELVVAGLSTRSPHRGSGRSTSAWRM